MTAKNDRSMVGVTVSDWRTVEGEHRARRASLELLERHPCMGVRLEGTRVYATWSAERERWSVFGGRNGVYDYGATLVEAHEAWVERDAHREAFAARSRAWARRQAQLERAQRGGER